MRLIACAALIGMLEGCIIYEEKLTSEGCRGCTSQTTPTGPGPGPGPDPGTQITDALELTVNTGYPGEQVLSTLVERGSGADIEDVVAVSFERDIAVIDSLVQPFDVVLLLEVGADAAPGPVEVYVEVNSGARYVLSRSFEILAPTVTTETGGSGYGGSGLTTDGTSGDSGADTGVLDTGSGDTGLSDAPPDDTGTSDTGTGFIDTDLGAGTGGTGL